MKNLPCVMLGGAVGAALRYCVGLLCTHFHCHNFPFSTFIVNSIGCFILGILTACGEKFICFTGATYLMFTVGLCGAFTTFSTFSADAIRLLDQGRWIVAFGYVAVSLCFGLLLFYLGKKIV